MRTKVIHVCMRRIFNFFSGGGVGVKGIFVFARGIPGNFLLFYYGNLIRLNFPEVLLPPTLDPSTVYTYTYFLLCLRFSAQIWTKYIDKTILNLKCTWSSGYGLIGLNLEYNYSGIEHKFYNIGSLLPTINDRFFTCKKSKVYIYYMFGLNIFYC